MAERAATEQDLWDICHDAKRRDEREYLERAFLDAFRGGHTSAGLRDFVHILAEDQWRKDIMRFGRSKNLRSIHPAAWKVLRRFGRTLPPAMLPHTIIRDVKRYTIPSQTAREVMSHLNAHREEKRKFLYAEGVVQGLQVQNVTPHAWNVQEFQGGFRVRDRTYYGSCKWNLYFGIVFSEEQYLRICRAAGEKYVGMPLFHTDTYPLFLRAICDVLRERHLKLISPPA